MEHLDNLIAYFEGNKHNKESLILDFNYILSNLDFLFRLYKDRFDILNCHLLALIEKYRYRFDLYLKAAFTNEFDQLTKEYLLNAEVPFETNIISPIEAHILKTLTYNKEVLDALIFCVKAENFGNIRLSEVESKIDDPNSLSKSLNEMISITDYNHYQYYNNTRFNHPEYSDEDYEEILTEIKRKSKYKEIYADLPMTKFYTWNYKDLVGEYGEHKVLEYLKNKYPDFNYNRVSLMGNGYGYDIAAYKNLTRVMGYEVKSTFNDPLEIDSFELSTNESGWIDKDSLYVVIRYSIQDDMIYIIYKDGDKYICEDQNKVHHTVELNGEMIKSFTIYKNQQKEEERGAR